MSGITGVATRVHSAPGKAKERAFINPLINNRAGRRAAKSQAKKGKRP